MCKRAELPPSHYMKNSTIMTIDSVRIKVLTVSSVSIGERNRCIVKNKLLHVWLFQKLPEVLDMEKVDDDRNRLRRQLQAVS